MATAPELLEGIVPAKRCLIYCGDSVCDCGLREERAAYQDRLQQHFQESRIRHAEERLSCMARQMKKLAEGVCGKKPEEELLEEEGRQGFDDKALRNRFGNCEICGEREHKADCPVRAIKDYLGEKQ